MRLRFSLRALMVANVAVAVLCYYWLVRPTVVASRLIAAIAAEDYEKADRLFLSVQDRTFAEWSEKTWVSFPKGKLAPLTFAQILSGQRDVYVYATYFAFDYHFNQGMQIVATPLGLRTPIVHSTESAISIGPLHNMGTPLTR